MEAFKRRLQDAGLKSTRQRDLIAQCFFRLDKHISADELLEEVRKEQGRIGYATVYRTLNLLEELGLAVPKDFGDGFTRYDPVYDQDPHHDHLICVDCRRIVEFHDAVIAERLDAFVRAEGFALRRKKLELYVECRTTDCPHRPEREP